MNIQPRLKSKYPMKNQYDRFKIHSMVTRIAICAVGVVNNRDKFPLFEERMGICFLFPVVENDNFQQLYFPKKPVPSPFRRSVSNNPPLPYH